MDYEYCCSRSDDELGALDVAAVNLSVTAGLPGSESLDISAVLARLDRWAELVGINTDHWRPKFVPQDDCRTDAEFRMMAMVTLLQRDIGVKYNPARMTGPFSSLDSRDSFLHGPLTGHGGTCSSLPILYLAIGRRLGYPLRLVHTIRHSFVRWDGPHGERFNVECAGVGFHRRDDEHYRQWPEPFTEAENADAFYLTNLTPRQELAAFVGDRAHCLLDNLRLDEALEAYFYATKLEPRYKLHWALATMMHRIIVSLRSKKLSSLFPFPAAIDLASRISVETRERNLLEEARKDLHRIALLHEQRRVAQLELAFTRTAVPSLLQKE